MAESPLCAIHELPQNILLEIFSYLDVKDLCRCNKVCKLWYQVSLDKTLWQKVKLTFKKFKLNILWKFLRARGFDTLKELQVYSFVGSGKTTQKVSTSLMKELSSKCPNIQSLTLFATDFSDVNISFLPQTLSYLDLDRSMIPRGWFDPLKTSSDLLQTLQTLNLHCCSKVCDNDLLGVTHLRALTSLDLSACYRITDTGIRNIARNLTNLSCLKLSCCSQLSDGTSHHIGRHLKKLVSLDLSGCFRITDIGLASIQHGLKELEKLILNGGCNEITANGIQGILTDCSKLRYLEIDKLLESKVRNFRESAPHCKINTS